MLRCSDTRFKQCNNYQSLVYFCTNTVTQDAANVKSWWSYIIQQMLPLPRRPRGIVHVPPLFSIPSLPIHSYFCAYFQFLKPTNHLMCCTVITGGILSPLPEQLPVICKVSLWETFLTSKLNQIAYYRCSVHLWLLLHGIYHYHMKYSTCVNYARMVESSGTWELESDCDFTGWGNHVS